MKRGAVFALTALAGVPPLVETPPRQRHRLLVAHRGASAYAPEHTLAAYRLAIEQGADFVEQDLAVTKDGVLICLHDTSLERTTDVRRRFPGRVSYLAADFTLADIKTLDAGAWFDARFAGERVPTFDEAIAAIAGRAGLMPELKDPAFYRDRNVDVPKLTAEALRRHGLDLAATDRTPVRARTPVMLQSFDEPAIRALKARLPDVPRVMLFDSTAARRYGTPEGLRELSRWATGIGPHKRVIEHDPVIISRAHALGMSVIPWTFRAADTGHFAGVREEMQFFLEIYGVDGLFTDNPDRFPRAAGRVRSAAPGTHVAAR